METKTVLHLGGKEFDKEVLQSAIPAVVDFYADWCGPCRMVSPIVESLSREYAGKVKFVKIDTDKNQGLAERYDIMSIPTVMIFKNGEIRDKIIGASPASLYKQKIDSALEN
ncbi:MAG: thioredoxin [Thaumarchaeota archaeon]|nr:thioredoxin [Nitrososphaerota archaeon]